MKINAPKDLPPGRYRATIDVVGPTGIEEITVVSKLVTERIPFRLLNMQCCNSLICHVNHRWPSYCSNCGARVFPDVRGWAVVEDMDATLRYKNG
jgi:hypothetical protein